MSTSRRAGGELAQALRRPAPPGAIEVTHRRHTGRAPAIRLQWFTAMLQAPRPVIEALQSAYRLLHERRERVSGVVSFRNLVVFRVPEHSKAQGPGSF